MSSQIEQAIRQICDEKGLAYDSVIETIETAMAAAYRKDFGEKNQNVEVEFDAESGDINVYNIKTVIEDISDEELEARRDAEIAKKETARAAEEERVRAKEAGEEVPEPAEEVESVEVEEEKVYNPKTDIMMTPAKEFNAKAELGEVLRMPLDVPGEFGRMAAQTAKQVITQKLREAEREIIYNQFKDLEGEVVNGVVQRREGRVILIDLGRTTGVLRSEDQIATERYNIGDRVKVFIREVALGSRGPEILVSRSSGELVTRLFEVEIPEIAEGIVEIKSIAREGGARSKVAVSTEDDSIDPIGACIGQRGTRIQTIISELGGEKIDIIEWSEDPKTFILNSLAPAKVIGVELNEEEKLAKVVVVADQLSLAIGRGGQNVRLAAKLTDWKINVSEAESEEGTEEGAEAEESSETAHQEVESETDDVKTEDVEPTENKTQTELSEETPAEEVSEVKSEEEPQEETTSEEESKSSAKDEEENA